MRCGTAQRVLGHIARAWDTAFGVSKAFQQLRCWESGLACIQPEMMQRRVLSGLSDLAGGGESAWKTACTVALGFAVGMFPLLGVTTIACVLLAKVLRLRQAPIQLGNYAALPLQILLVIPFLRLGERLTGAERFVFDPPALLKGFPHIPDSTARAVVMAQWHMIAGWAVVAPMAFALAALVAKVLLRAQLQIVDVRRAA